MLEQLLEERRALIKKKLKLDLAYLLEDNEKKQLERRIGRYNEKNSTKFYQVKFTPHHLENEFKQKKRVWNIIPDSISESDHLTQEDKIIIVKDYYLRNKSELETV